MSVTQLISDENDSGEITLKQPEFMLQNQDNQTGTERGTIIHKFLQFFDFSIDVSDIEDEKWIFFFSSEVKECNVLLNENWSENLQEVSVFQYLYDMETDRLYLLSAG